MTFDLCEKKKEIFDSIKLIPMKGKEKVQNVDESRKRKKRIKK